jgi:hypothetical protein
MEVQEMLHILKGGSAISASETELSEIRYKSTAMRNIRNLSRIKSIIRHSGLSIKNRPSIEHPIAVTLFYRNNADGTVGSFWPKGNRLTAFSELYCRRSVKWIVSVYATFFALGLEGFLAHGRLVVYADLPTATYLQQLWKRD